MLRASSWRLPGALLIIALLAAAAKAVVAFVLIPDGHLGIDGGTYLINRDEWLGVAHDVIIHARPPLAPGLMIIPFTASFGDETGLRVWAIAASMPLVPAMYCLARGMLTVRQSLAAAAIAGTDFWVFQFAINGAVTHLPFALLLIVTRAILDWSLGRSPNKLTLAAVALSLAAIPWLNQSVAGLTVLYLPVMTAAGAWFRWRQGLPISGRDGFRLSAAVAVGALAALTTLQWYIPVAPGGDTVKHFDGDDMLALSPFLTVRPFTAHVWLVVVVSAAYARAQAAWSPADYRADADGLPDDVAGLFRRSDRQPLLALSSYEC